MRADVRAVPVGIVGKEYDPRLLTGQDPRDYRNRRIAEGKTPREAIRCLKRYIARELYQLITKPQPTPIADPSAA